MSSPILRPSFISATADLMVVVLYDMCDTYSHAKLFLLPLHISNHSLLLHVYNLSDIK